MKTLWQFILAFTLLLPVCAYSGTPTLTNLAIPGVTFTIALSDSVVKVGSVNTLSCHIASTNYQVWLDGGSDVALVLTNSAGKTLVLARTGSGIYGETSLTVEASAQKSYSAEKDRPYEWQMSVLIPPSIPPGTYVLVALKPVMIRKAPSRRDGSHNPCGMLASDPVHIEVRPAPGAEGGKP